MSDAPRDVTAPPGAPTVSVLLIGAGVLLIGWFCWLGATALSKSRAPIVSRAQAALATVPVRAKLAAGTDDKPAMVVTVVESLRANGPAKDAVIAVRNLPAAVGYTGPGEYLLLLARDGDLTIEGHPAYVLARVERSPGSESGDPALIYPWTEQTGDDLRQQVKRLLP